MESAPSAPGLSSRGRETRVGPPILPPLRGQGPRVRPRVRPLSGQKRRAVSTREARVRAPGPRVRPWSKVDHRVWPRVSLRYCRTACHHRRRQCRADQRASSQTPPSSSSSPPDHSDPRGLGHSASSGPHQSSLQSPRRWGRTTSSWYSSQAESAPDSESPSGHPELRSESHLGSHPSPLNSESGPRIGSGSGLSDPSISGDRRRGQKTSPTPGLETVRPRPRLREVDVGVKRPRPRQASRQCGQGRVSAASDAPQRGRRGADQA